MEFSSINPATEVQLSTWPVASDGGREAHLSQAHTAARGWAHSSTAERAALLRAAAGRMRAGREELARLATHEMGKPIVEARAEVDKCAAACEFFAEHGPAMLADEPVASNADESLIAYRPLGLIFAIMPWNYPYWQVIRHAAPALMAGNGVLVKHAENTLGCAHALAGMFGDGPDHLVSTIVATIEASAEIIVDRRVAAVTLTGSTRAGAPVAATAGGAWKKTVLELGGSDAFVVLEDADVPAAAAMAVKARFQNAGQSCIAAKRFIVLAPVARAFTEAFVAHARELRVGDPGDTSTTIGPMARADLRAGVVKQLEESVAGGAKVLLDGGARPGAGWFFEPVVLAVEDLRLPVWSQEVFGPVAPITIAHDENQALEMANDCDYGLGGNVWTADPERGKAFAQRMESGAVFVNGMTASDPRLPFGGVKRSGYGRELSVVGIREFTNVQTVWVGPAH